jgi:hypothetical protein
MAYFKTLVTNVQLFVNWVMKLQKCTSKCENSSCETLYIRDTNNGFWGCLKRIGKC